MQGRVLGLSSGLQSGRRQRGVAAGGGYGLDKGLAVAPPDPHQGPPCLMAGPGGERKGHSSDHIPPRARTAGQVCGGARGHPVRHRGAHPHGGWGGRLADLCPAGRQREASRGFRLGWPEQGRGKGALQGGACPSRPDRSPALIHTHGEEGRPRTEAPRSAPLLDLFGI